VKKPTLSYPYVRVDAAGSGVVSHAGGVLPGLRHDRDMTAWRCYVM